MMNILHAEYLKHYYILPHGTIKQSQIKCLYMSNNMTTVITAKMLISFRTHICTVGSPNINCIKSKGRTASTASMPCFVKGKSWHFQSLFYKSCCYL